MKFKNKVAFITGAAIGFGRVFARRLCEEGAAVAIVDIDSAAARFTADELAGDGFRALPVTCDVSDENSVDLAVKQAITQLGGIDILINNAGKHLSKYNQPFSVLQRDEIRALFDVNIMGIVNCSVACRESMSARGGGSILNISSIAGYLSTTPYGVSKLAVRGLTIAFASEFSADKIRVNAIAPGLIATENAMVDLPKDFVDHFTGDLQMIKRLGQIQDIVSAMLYLCSDDAGFVTGETLRVSGGYPLSLG